MPRCAVVFFNLGGPDSLDAVEPFLFNLFSDPAIITSPNPIRYFLARLISWRRAPVAKEIYKLIGGASPLLSQTEMQAQALDDYLTEPTSEIEYKTFISMRYWHPFSKQVVKQVQDYDPDQIILLPLYPQFSTTTTRSSFNDWDKTAEQAGLKVPTAKICCYPYQKDFITSYAGLIAPIIEKLQDTSYRILFSAHGLPRKFIERGDPYQWQVEQTNAAIAKALEIDDLDWVSCYQSRVGPVEWISPATEDEIIRAAKDNKALIIVPVAFVSEHSETLVELDIEYADLARKHGVTAYHRIETVGVQQDFIRSLGCLVKTSRIGVTESSEGMRLCPNRFSQCLYNQDIR